MKPQELTHIPVVQRQPNIQKQTHIPKTRNKTINDYNSSKSTLQRSPKVSTNKFRSEAYFSLLDVNLSQVSRGTKTPLQYIRYTDTQMKELASINPPIKQQQQQNQELKNTIDESKTIETNQVKPKERNINSACPISRIDRVLGYKYNNSHQLENITQRDPNMPKGYTLYEDKVKTEVKTNNNNPESTKRSYIKIKAKGINSTVFDREEYKTIRVREFKTHDIFGRKEDDNKDNGPVKVHFSGMRESGSAWLPKFVSPTYYNHSSIKHNIINPNVKALSMTMKQVKETNKTLEPSHRQTGFCEYIDLTRNTAPNINKDYVQFRNRPKSSFDKSRGICTNYYDSYNSYKDLCDKPFYNYKNKNNNKE